MLMSLLTHLGLLAKSLDEALHGTDAQEFMVEPQLPSSYTNVRWMIRRDMVSVLEIENQAFGFDAWSEEEFRQLRQRNTIGMVAERNDQVVGFMIYELHKNRLYLLNFAVVEHCRRSGVGSAMIGKLKSKLTPDRRNRITLDIRETNLPGQLFFKAMGFRAVTVLRNYYDDCSEDAYSMVYRCNSFGDSPNLTVFRGEE